MFILLLLLSFNLFAAEAPASSPLDDDGFCDAAISMWRRPEQSELDRYIKPHLKRVLKQRSPSNEDISYECNSEVVRKIKSGEDNYEMHEKRIHEMMVDSIRQAFAEKEHALQLKEARIKEKYSGKKTATIAVIASICSTICGSICSVVVALKSK